ncbi:flavodoxin family protein [Solimonas soli]|uniref:flavodoxin family protein n=1 Tax=Solimonas soli TaxID=413479 RepID=UPI0004B4B189|nr:flavodoxin [Solimonas soli]
MKQNLVVYYSHSGCSRQVAERLAAGLDADLEEIVELHRRRGPLGMARCVIDAWLGREPGIVSPMHSPHAYERVIVGGPVWANHIASPVRSYLSETMEELPRVAFFCCCGRDGAHALGDMASLSDCTPEATLMMLDREIQAGDFAKLDDFVARLRKTGATAASVERAA